MKTLKPFYFLLLFLPMMGCDLLEDAVDDEIERTITFDGDLAIAESSAVSSMDDPIDVTTEMGYYAITSDPDISSLLEDGNAEITKIKIDEIRYTYKDFVGNEEAVVQEASFKVLTGSYAEMNSSLENGIAIAEADEKNTLFTHKDDFSTIEKALLDSPVASLVAFRYHGRISRNPVDFKVAIRVYITVMVKVTL